jgi:hypothetical protein
MQLAEQFSFIPYALPVAPRPCPDELISSWLQRIACANALTLSELLAFAFLRAPETRGSIDLLDEVSPKVASVIAELGRVPRRWVSVLSFSRQFPAWSKQWLMRRFNSAGDWGRSIRARYAFCPRCLREMSQGKQTIWIRAEWACALITYCRLHRTRLHEICPVCFVEDPVSPGPTFGDAVPCRRCFCSLALAIQLSPTPGGDDVLQVQDRLFTDSNFARQTQDAVEDLLREFDGTPLFLLIADKNPECEQFLRGRTVPEANLCFYSWQWRLVLAKALAEITVRDNC